MLSFVDLAKPRNLSENLYYITFLSMSLEKRKRLYDIIKSDDSWRGKNTGVYYTNLYAHHTQWTMHKQYPEFKELTIMIDNYICHSVCQIPFSYETKESWGGIYGKDDYAQKHSHEPNLWAWCYYPFAPEGSSPLCFHRSMIDHDGKEESVYPSDNLLVIFPGHLLHSVPKSTIDQERVVIAGNVYLPLKPFGD